ncbi:UDP-2,3-diacylglucosamine diphosphatase [Pontibacter sp. G13]|uniref:UDP-2,3-diacylglucosamine diphosphatase n=1 Tax=Pontibacter sp. G13 TaxID=3074898 RepID=UPI00288B2F0E|nr:UDP-2,3-diacylglucosamine diphosphatase [Pontibacter sp. G13]WNJ19424.1 UDP-2,3-diacylglucosamine diphosphatase [Pontibacter sp. G13]
MLTTGKKIYAASDMHLGAPDAEMSLVRERHLVKWLRHIAPDAAEIYLIGDIFDFWFEYKHVVPKGYARLMGTLAELSDAGIKLHIFAGNHDLWYKDYFPEQFGAEVHHGPIIREFFGKTYYLAHGDGLGPGDHGYKFMKRVFTNRFCKWLFKWLHPDLGVGLARIVSGKGSHAAFEKMATTEVKHLGDREYLYQHAKAMVKTHPEIDHYVFGHRHMLLQEEIHSQRYITMLGDWIRYFSFLEINEFGCELSVFPMQEHPIVQSVASEHSH